MNGKFYFTELHLACHLAFLEARYSSGLLVLLGSSIWPVRVLWLWYRCFAVVELIWSWRWRGSTIDYFQKLFSPLLLSISLLGLHRTTAACFVCFPVLECAQERQIRASELLLSICSLADVSLPVFQNVALCVKHVRLVCLTKGQSRRDLKKKKSCGSMDDVEISIKRTPLKEESDFCSAPLTPS